VLEYPLLDEPTPRKSGHAASFELGGRQQAALTLRWDVPRL
jgi:hypothetical protein